MKAGRILITGGTGFIGSHLARTLADEGQSIVCLGRNKYAAPRIFHPRISFIRGDIRHPEDVLRAVQGAEVVYHAAALTQDWARWADFEAVNVKGTQNVIDACRTSRVRRLVHISSAAVFFRFSDFSGIGDDDPLPPATFLQPTYPRSKQMAEVLVQSACAKGLDAVIVRVRGVFGPGDNALLPRVLEAFEAGRLRQIGDGLNLTDLTYIDNAVHGIMLAAKQGKTGHAYTITNDEPVRLWVALRSILSELSNAHQPSAIPRFLAFAAATVAESVSAISPTHPRPVLTRYGVTLLSRTQTFNIDKARRELGYEPVVRLSEGIRRTAEIFAPTILMNTAATVKLKLFTTGYTLQRHSFAESGASNEQIAFHGTFALIEHPEFGLSMFDTGYAPHLEGATERLPFRLYSRLAPIARGSMRSARDILVSAGIDPMNVRRIIISHFHADHIAGLKDFPDVDYIGHDAAWEDVKGRAGIGALQRAFIPSLLPENFGARLSPIRSFHDAGFENFHHTHDLFGDGSVRLVELPGHARGMMGALLRTTCENVVFLVADAAYTRRSIECGAPPHWITSCFTDSRSAMIKTLKRIQTLHQRRLPLTFVPTHCPEVAKEIGEHRWN
jgi:nucleoside-diphosphate-sugar epimerase/glyoxylase-like metal-dependent hydrolase (beta-lactamase superfamily II)